VASITTMLLITTSLAEKSSRQRLSYLRQKIVLVLQFSTYLTFMSTKSKTLLCDADIHGICSYDNVFAYTHIGGRAAQEDRFVISSGRLALTAKNGDAINDCLLAGVFDGTVGDFASENVQYLVVDALLRSRGWAEYRTLRRDEDPNSTSSSDAMISALTNAVMEMHASADGQLLARCAEMSKHYSSCTSVVAIVARDLLVVSHLGDSRACLVLPPAEGGHRGEFLTVDHRPDAAEERRRIEGSGGSVVFLHNHQDKPFVRGGDFTRRKAAGEQPMQLQYSRAFGGKDLKMFGLSAEPTVRIVRHKGAAGVILASDGLWDVYKHASQAAEVALGARRAGQSPAEALVRSALEEQAHYNQASDNITALVIAFD
jgi:serine/threonine protein phosphatase PrpC